MTAISQLEPEARTRWLIINGALGGLLALIALTGFGTPTQALPGALLLTGGVVVRMYHPTLALVLATVGGLWQVAFSNAPGIAPAAVLLVTYSMARWGDTITRRVTLVVMAIASIAGPLSWMVPVVGSYVGLASQLRQVGAMALFCALAVGSTYLFGRTVRTTLASRAERFRAQQERERHALVEREQQFRMNSVHERNRIARELHDIIAHSLSVIVVQAEGGKAMAAKNPQLAQQVLTTIADTSRTSLAEMRTMVRLLRGEGEDAEDYVPTPGLADIPALVEKTGNATLHVEGDMPTVSEGVGLAAYRVVQESLTNVLKHAGPQARATVSISYWPGEIQLEIKDNGRGAAAHSDGQGHGVRGMQERLEIHGGQLLARPQVGGGFLVRARLPYGNAAEPPGVPPPHAGQTPAASWWPSGSAE